MKLGIENPSWRTWTSALSMLCICEPRCNYIDFNMNRSGLSFLSDSMVISYIAYKTNFLWKLYIQILKFLVAHMTLNRELKSSRIIFIFPLQIKLFINKNPVGYVPSAYWLYTVVFGGGRSLANRPWMQTPWMQTPSGCRPPGLMTCDACWVNRMTDR